jgi:hypothetical protein
MSIAGQMSAVPQLEPGHRPRAALPPPPPRRKPRNELKPPAALRIPASRTQPRHLRAAAIGHLHPDNAVPGPDRDRNRPARGTRPAMPDAVTEQLAHQQGSVIPARVPGTEHPDCERAGDPRPLRPPSQRHALPDLQPSHHRAPAFPGRPPREITGNAMPDARMHAQLSGSRQAGTCGLRGPSVAVRGKPTVCTDRPGGRTPSAICPWTPRHSGLQRYKMTRDGTGKKRPASTRISS